jgi:hypothetical protein
VGLCVCVCGGGVPVPPRLTEEQPGHRPRASLPARQRPPYQGVQRKDMAGFFVVVVFLDRPLAGVPSASGGTKRLSLAGAGQKRSTGRRFGAEKRALVGAPPPPPPPPDVFFIWCFFGIERHLLAKKGAPNGIYWGKRALNGISRGEIDRTLLNGISWPGVSGRKQPLGESKTSRPAGIIFVAFFFPLCF